MLVMKISTKEITMIQFINRLLVFLKNLFNFRPKNGFPLTEEQKQYYNIQSKDEHVPFI